MVEAITLQPGSFGQRTALCVVYLGGRQTTYPSSPDFSSDVGCFVLVLDFF